MNDDERTSALQFLVSRGWSRQPWDQFCWLECSDPGHLLQRKGRDGVVREIALCIRHAVILEHGVLAEDYSGAPLPPDTMSISWPWREVPEAA